MDKHTYDQILFTQATTPHMQEVWEHIGDCIAEDMYGLQISEKDTIAEAYNQDI